MLLSAVLHVWATLLKPQSVIRALAEAETPLRVWIDIGTSYRSLATWDLEQNSSLIVVGIDAMRKHLEHREQSKSPRFLPVEGACSAANRDTVTFYAHGSPTCGTMLKTAQGGPAIGSGSWACTGDTPRTLTVPVFHLDKLIHSLRKRLPEHRLEFLKLDVQGAELDCLRSGKAELAHVDNILLEVQDVTTVSKLGLYEGAPGINALDSFLDTVGFRRQYCEWNKFTRQIREINCMYSNVRKTNVTWLWATGNFKKDRSMVSYGKNGRNYLHLDFVKQLQTATFLGDRM